nr:Gag-Pol polymerase [Tanacetum cinerariifolium]
LCKQEEAGIQLNAEQADWKDDTDDESNDQELEAHYMYMAKVQEVSPYAVDSRPIFDTDPEQKIQNDDHYNVFAIELDMSYDREEIDQNDDDNDRANEHAIVEAIRIGSKWEYDDYICRGHILNGMSDSLFDVYTNVESAKELWEVILTITRWSILDWS